MKDKIKIAMFDELVKINRHRNDYNEGELETVLESFDNVLSKVFSDDTEHISDIDIVDAAIHV